MKYVLKYQGGSHSYALNTPSSDLDIRGIFIHTDPQYILGIKRWDHLENSKNGADDMFFEIRHFFNLLKNGNTQAYECLFLSNSCRIENTEEYNILIRNRENFLDSEKLFKSLMGYIQSERRLAIGERTGKLGGKRIELLEKYGFSPKNFVQLVRLSWAGSYFFEKGIFPVKISDYNSNLSELLLSIKTKPELHSKDNLLELTYQYEEKLKSSFDNRKLTRKFNEEKVNNLLLEFYYPFLTEKYDQIKNESLL